MSEAKPAMPPGAPPAAGGPPAPAASAPLFLGLVLVGCGFLLLYLRFGVGARLDAATLGLAAALGALMYALRGLFWMVQALSRRDVETVIAGETAGPRLRSELRDEKRRVLRAIKELDFDHQMGKLSDEDHREIGARYKLRAVEIMRQLDGAGDLHPELARVLEGLHEPSPTLKSKPEEAPAAQNVQPPAPSSEAPAEAGAQAAAEAPAQHETRACPECDTANDLDAKFCKSCGKELAA